MRIDDLMASSQPPRSVFDAGVPQVCGDLAMANATSISADEVHFNSAVDLHCALLLFLI